ncbi:type I 3-dehydroquinate dehydratase [Carnimonas nigrificans]|uniref:type I 3-dehydroquinate dehydratase n=1 Tax=Carnimonas nigrificans TaxID=64323 RepID=UPI0004708B36|nr:type I 3-dehydroquinate dehydratase [Carnimonas nigrificans]
MSDVNHRRRFLTGTSAMLGAIAMGYSSRDLFAADAHASPVRAPSPAERKMTNTNAPAIKNPLFINTIILGGSVEEKVTAARQAGFQQIELWRQDVEHFAQGPARLKSLLDEQALGLTDYQVLLDFDGAPPDKRAAKREEAVQMLETAKAVGATTLLVPASTDRECQAQRVVEDMRWLTQQAAQRNLRIAYEGMAWSTVNPTLPAAWRVVQEIDAPNLGLVVDAFHIFVRKRTAADLDGIPLEKIFLVQLSDLGHDEQVTADNLVDIARHRRLLPGDGDFPLDSLLERLKGYTGPIGLEVFNDEMRSQPPAEVAQKAMSKLRKVLGIPQRLKRRGDMPAVLVPVTQGDTAEALAFISKAQHAPAIDFLELRLDMLTEAPSAQALSRYVASALHQMDKTGAIVTFRTKAEGGETAISTQEYVRLYESVLAHATPDFIDVEINRGEQAVAAIIENARQHGVGVILSSHDFKATAPRDELLALMERMHEVGADVVKVATMPNDMDDVLALLSASWAFKQQHPDHELISMSMGELGVISRLAGEVFGSDATFGMIGTGSAPGQVEVEKLSHCLTDIHSIIA